MNPGLIPLDPAGILTSLPRETRGPSRGPSLGFRGYNGLIFRVSHLPAGEEKKPVPRSPLWFIHTTRVQTTPPQLCPNTSLILPVQNYPNLDSGAVYGSDTMKSNSSWYLPYCRISVNISPSCIRTHWSRSNTQFRCTMLKHPVHPLVPHFI